jgi:hypothetical protein
MAYQKDRATFHGKTEPLKSLYGAPYTPVIPCKQQKNIQDHQITTTDPEMCENKTLNWKTNNKRYLAIYTNEAP